MTNSQINRVDKPDNAKENALEQLKVQQELLHDIEVKIAKGVRITDEELHKISDTDMQLYASLQSYNESKTIQVAEEEISPPDTSDTAARILKVAEASQENKPDPLKIRIQSEIDRLKKEIEILETANKPLVIKKNKAEAFSAKLKEYTEKNKEQIKEVLEAINEILKMPKIDEENYKRLIELVNSLNNERIPSMDLDELNFKDEVAPAAKDQEGHAESSVEGIETDAKFAVISRLSNTQVELFSRADIITEEDDTLGQFQYDKQKYILAEREYREKQQRGEPLKEKNFSILSRHFKVKRVTFENFGRERDTDLKRRIIEIIKNADKSGDIYLQSQSAILECEFGNDKRYLPEINEKRVPGGFTQWGFKEKGEYFDFAIYEEGVDYSSTAFAKAFENVAIDKVTLDTTNKEHPRLVVKVICTANPVIQDLCTQRSELMEKEKKLKKEMGSIRNEISKLKDDIDWSLSSTRKVDSEINSLKQELLSLIEKFTPKGGVLRQKSYSVQNYNRIKNLINSIYSTALIK